MQLDYRTLLTLQPKDGLQMLVKSDHFTPEPSPRLCRQQQQHQQQSSSGSSDQAATSDESQVIGRMAAHRFTSTSGCQWGFVSAAGRLSAVRELAADDEPNGRVGAFGRRGDAESALGFGGGADRAVVGRLRRAAAGRAARRIRPARATAADVHEDAAAGPASPAQGTR